MKMPQGKMLGGAVAVILGPPAQTCPVTQGSNPKDHEGAMLARAGFLEP